MNVANCLIALAAFVAAPALAATAPPSAGVWNIATTGKAASSGDLAFRVTATDGSDPVDITVPVMAGATEDSVARSIRRVLSSQLPRDRYAVELGQGSNVLVSDPRGRPNFTLELVDSDIENVRVAVQSVTPAAAPTVPPQATPAEPPPTSRPAPTVPGNAAPPAIRTPTMGEGPIPVPDPIRVPGPAPTVPSPSQSAPPPASVPAPSPAAPPENAPPIPDKSLPPVTPPPASAPPTSPAPNSSGGSGAAASAPPPTDS